MIDTSLLQHTYAVILAGGSGTRLWPMSRDNTPKQFLKLGGTHTLLQRTPHRLQPHIPAERTIVVTNAQYVDEVRAQLPDIPVENIIAEPEKRDTALAMALGTLVALHHDPEAIVVNAASDHVLKDEAEFQRVMLASINLAATGEYLVTVGIKPTGPNVNFGYIEAAGELTQVDGSTIYRVNSFKEKPDLQTAQRFVDQGNYYWNANMYTWSGRALLQAFHEYQPQFVPGLDRLSQAIGTPQFADVLRDVYANAEKISIDYAISEKAHNLVLIPGDFGWDDIGLWSTVYDLGQKDENGTVLVREGGDQSPMLAIDAKNNLVHTSGRLVALLGVEDLVVIDSESALLIVPRSRAAEVKNVVALVKEKGLDTYL